MLENADKLNEQAIDLALHGDFIDAIECFKRAITIERHNSLLWFNLGMAYKDAGELEKAKFALEKAYAFNGEDTDSIENLAIICHSMGNDTDALEYCSLGLDIDDRNPHVWNTTGAIMFSNGDYSEACDAFEKAVTLNPYYYDALYNLRDTYKKLGNDIGIKICEENMKSISKEEHHA